MAELPSSELVVVSAQNSKVFRFIVAAKFFRIDLVDLECVLGRAPSAGFLIDVFALVVSFFPDLQFGCD